MKMNLSRVAIRMAVVLAFSLLLVSPSVLEASAEMPHNTIYYRICGSLTETLGDAKIVGSWRFTAKVNAAGGWEDGEKEFNWYDREWSFEAEFVMHIPNVGRQHYSLRNTILYSYGGRASWYGAGHGKREAGPYNFMAKGYVDLFINGKLFAEHVRIDARIIRETLEDSGKISLLIVHEHFNDVAGGTLKGEVHRFQAIDFMT